MNNLRNFSSKDQRAVEKHYSTYDINFNNLNDIINSLIKLGFRRFKKEDWYGYAGAERFPDGSNPMIKSDKDMDIIVDGNGTFIISNKDNTSVSHIGGMYNCIF